jgi:hypothetical protein
MGHHYVPQRYLRGFEIPDNPGYIWTYDKERKVANALPIKQVAQSPGFYTEEVERELADQVETPAGDVIDKIKRGEKVDDDIDRRHLTYHIATMIRRVPRARVKADEMVPGVLAEVATETREKFAEAVRHGIIPEGDLATHLAEIDRVEKRFQQHTPKEVRRVIETPWPFASMLFVIDAMSWQVFRSNGPSFFLTSDNPATFFEGFGLGHPECELILPLGTDMLLHCSWQQIKEMAVAVAHQQIVKEFNRRIVVNADRFIFYHQEAPWVFEVARNKPEQLNRIRFVPASARL